MAFIPKWTEFRLLTFDCYGTLIDWEAGILDLLRPWSAAYQLQPSDDELLAAFAAAESAVQRSTPEALYSDVLRDAMARIATAFGKTATAGEQAALGDSVGDWPAFPDTEASLRTLKSWHKLMVVSNVDKASFAKTRHKLGVELDGLVTAEEVGAYKPDKRMFERAFAVARDMGVQPRQILHVGQSVFHDIAPAKELGVATVWVDRRAGKSGGATPKSDAAPDLRVTSLAELVAIEQKARHDKALP